jgi:hypothetical protein
MSRTAGVVLLRSMFPASAISSSPKNVVLRYGLTAGRCSISRTNPNTGSSRCGGRSPSASPFTEEFRNHSQTDVSVAAAMRSG